MKIENQNGSVKIGPFSVKPLNQDEIKRFDFGATTPSPLEGVSGLFAKGEWVPVSAALKSDSEGQRRSLANFDNQAVAAVVESGLSRALELARGIMANDDLRPEIKSRRAAEPIMEALGLLDEKLVAPVRAQVAVYEGWKKIVEGAFTPEAPKAGLEAVQELRAQEIRRVMESASSENRVLMLDALAKAGNLDALGALRSDPAGRVFVPGEIMSMAERVALDVHGAGFVMDDLERSRDLAVAAGYRAAALVRAVSRLIPANTGGFEPGRLTGNDFEGMAAAAIAASE